MIAPGRTFAFAAGALLGLGAGCAATVAATSIAPPRLLRPVTVTLHWFDRVPSERARFDEWIGYLRGHHREAVETLGRERTYLEAMFTAADEPGRLYWLTVEGAGGASVETSSSELDRRHVAYMDAVLVKGSHRRLDTRNVLAPDFAIAAVRAEQGREGH